MALRCQLRRKTAVVDGELAVLDDRGRPDFYALLYRRSAPVFVAFDVLAVDGRDVRGEPSRRGSDAYAPSCRCRPRRWSGSPIQ